MDHLPYIGTKKGVNNMYEQGDWIETGDIHDNWVRRKFIAMIGQNVICVDDDYADEAIDQLTYDCLHIYTKYRPAKIDKYIPYTLDTFPHFDCNVKLKPNNKADNIPQSWLMILDVGNLGFSVYLKRGLTTFTFVEGLKKYQWLTGNGQTAPFGIKE